MCPNRIDTSAGNNAEVGSSRMMIRASLPIALAIATISEQYVNVIVVCFDSSYCLLQ